MQCPGQTFLSITSLAYYDPPFPPFLPHPVCSGCLAVAHVTPPWASSTLTDDDNILSWSGSPISGTQTQISGSSLVKRASGTLPRLPNLNQQRSCETDRAWTAIAFAPPPSNLCHVTASPTSSFVSLSPSVNLPSFFQWLKRCHEK